MNDKYFYIILILVSIFFLLDLFRANVTDELPNSLKNQVKRSWQQKYDALLNLNTQLKRELHLKNTMIKEKNCEVINICLFRVS